MLRNYWTHAMLVPLTLVGVPGSVVGQNSEEIRLLAEEAASGCYAIRPEEEPAAWLQSIEGDVWLTLEELLPDPENSSPIYVARPAPGERASEFASNRWTVVESGQWVAIRWGSGVVFVVITFPLTRPDDPGGVNGLATYSSDVSEPPDSVEVRVERFNC